MSDIVAEGFSPGVLDSWGLGYDALRDDQAGHHLRPAVGHGRAGHVRALPHRRPDRELRSPGCRRCRACPSPRCRRAGATRTSTGWAPTASRSRCSPRSSTASAPAKGSGSTPRRPRSGSSSAAPRILDWSANGRIWTRYGNRSPYKPAAPHGVYPLRGRRPLARDRVLHRGRVARARRRSPEHPEWASDRALRDARRAARSIRMRSTR